MDHVPATGGLPTCTAFLANPLSPQEPRPFAAPAPFPGADFPAATRARPRPSERVEAAPFRPPGPAPSRWLPSEPVKLRAAPSETRLSPEEEEEEPRGGTRASPTCARSPSPSAALLSFFLSLPPSLSHTQKENKEMPPCWKQRRVLRPLRARILFRRASSNGAKVLSASACGEGLAEETLASAETTSARQKMAHSERPHHNTDYRQRESRYIEERNRKPYPSNGRSPEGTTENPRYPTAFADPHQNNPGTVREYVDSSPPLFYPRKETFSEKCSNLCSRRGILQFVEITLNILVLVCIGAAQASISGFTSMGGLGSFNINSAYSPFEGVELQEVRDLDMQFNQMRAPCVYGGVAFSLTLLCLTILFLVAGGKPIHRLTVRLLVTECVFDVLACLAYIVAVGLYLHFVLQVNATEVCKKRERLYARRGYTSMNCSVQGGDASVALFGLLVACLYFASTVVCFLTIRSVREFQRQAAKVQYSLERTYSEGDQHKAYKRPESIDGARTFATLV
ncbi:domain-containing 3-like [Podarcis lilfordi]|uniref:Domain-containing 3-like n=1 Tax=Podarcis lilfordi TaxID=74358 RepID=A0AA35KKU6_9SAUR|nr:domain-containing 3-like [Podarcis lilfordi]